MVSNRSLFIFSFKVRLFVLHTLLYIVALFFSVGVVFMGLNLTMYAKSTVTISEEVKGVILGHSHSANALNDSIIKGVKNFSGGGESYFYLYHKLDLILRSNSNVNFVFVEFTNNSITPIMDEWIWNEANLSARYPDYSMLLGLDDYFLLARNNPMSILQYSGVAMQKALKRAIFRDYEFSNILGGYVHRSGVLDVQNSEHLQENMEHDVFVLNAHNIRYLLKMKSLCERENIDFHLIRSPQHPSLATLVNECVFQSVRVKYFDEVPFLDFSKFPLEDIDFIDREHLNARGASKFSKHFDYEIRSLLSCHEGPE
jgi:hypothetical protein